MPRYVDPGEVESFTPPGGQRYVDPTELEPIEPEGAEPTWLDTGITGALRIVPAIAGAALGTPFDVVTGPAGTAIGGAAGAGLGELGAEAYEKWRGLRKEINPLQVAVQGAIGAIPLGKSLSVGKAALKGMGLGAAADVGTAWADDRTPSIGEVTMAGGLGALLGGGSHAAVSYLQRRAAARVGAGLNRSLPGLTERAAGDAPSYGYTVDPATVIPAEQTALAALLKGETAATPLPELNAPLASRFVGPGSEVDVSPVRQGVRLALGRLERGQGENPPVSNLDLLRRIYGRGETMTPGFARYAEQDAAIQAQAAAEQADQAARVEGALGGRTRYVPESELLPTATTMPIAQNAERTALADLLRAGEPPAAVGPGAEAAAADVQREAEKQSLFARLRRLYGRNDQPSPGFARYLEADQAVQEQARQEAQTQFPELQRALGLRAAEESAAREASARSFMEPPPAANTRLAELLGVPRGPENPDLARYIAADNAIQAEVGGTAKSRPVAYLNPDERARLSDVLQTFDKGAPALFGGAPELEPFYEAVRAAGNSNWTRADIRNGIAAILDGKPNLIGQTALKVSETEWPKEAEGFIQGVAKRVPRDEPYTGGAGPGFQRYLARDAEIARGVGQDAELAARREAEAEAAFLVDDGAPLPPRPQGKQIDVQATHGRAMAKIGELRAQGVDARLGETAPGYFEIIEGEAVPPTVSREPGEEGFARAGLYPKLAGMLGGGAVGATQGDTPEERLKYGAIGAALGLAGGAGVARLAGRAAPQTAEGLIRAEESAGAGPQTRLRTIAKFLGDREVPSAKDIPAERLLAFGSEKFPKQLRPIMEQVIADNDGWRAQRRHVIPDARLNALAHTIEVQADRPLKPGTNLPPEAHRAYAQSLASLIDRTREASANAARLGVKAGMDAASMSDDQVRALLELSQAQSAASAVFESYEGLRAEAGRALRTYRLLRSIEPSEITVVRDMVKRGRFDRDLVKLSQMWASVDANDPVAVYRMLRDLQKSSIPDKISSYWMSNVLSGVKTQERNILGNASRTVLGLVNKGLVAGPLDALKAKLSGGERQVYSSEVLQDVKGLVYSARKAVDDALFTLKEGFSKEWVETAVDLDEGFVPRREFAGGGKNPLNYPGRALDAADRFFYQLNHGAELYSQSYAIARREAERAKLAGGAFDDYVAKRMADLRLNPDIDLQRSVHQGALEATYRENAGAFAGLLTAAREKIPGFRFVMPFVKTVANIFRQGYEYSPLSGIVKGGKYLAGNKEAWNRAGGGAREATTMQAKALLGTLGSVGFALLAAEGRLSGSGPKDRAEKAQLMASGWRPNSVKMALPDAIASALGASKSDDGEYWVNYSLLQPISIPMAVTANAYEAWQDVQKANVKSTRPQDVSELFSQTVARIANSAMNQSYLQGLFAFTDALQNPEKSASKMLEQVALGFVPMAGLARNVTQAVDPVIRDPKGLGQAAETIIPGLSQNVKPRLGRFGEPLERSGGAIRRGFMVPEVEPTTNDWIDQELNRLGVNVGTPTDRLELPAWFNGSRKISEDESYALRQARGKATRANLALLMQAPGYQQLPDPLRREMIRRAIEIGASQAATAGRASMITRRPELLRLLTEPMARVAGQSYRPGQRRGA